MADSSPELNNRRMEGRYQLERDDHLYVIRDTATGELVQHRTLRIPERYRSALRVQRRLKELELDQHRAHGETEERKWWENPIGHHWIR